jgi:hypothetical protein
MRYAWRRRPAAPSKLLGEMVGEMIHCLLHFNDLGEDRVR